MTGWKRFQELSYSQKRNSIFFIFEIKWNFWPKYFPFLGLIWLAGSSQDSIDSTSIRILASNVRGLSFKPVIYGKTSDSTEYLMLHHTKASSTKTLKKILFRLLSHCHFIWSFCWCILLVDLGGPYVPTVNTNTIWSCL